MRPGDGGATPPLPNPSPAAGRRARKEPRWAIAFLRALERTGEARAAAKDAGVDHTTAYARRRAHPEFADRWAAALAAHSARVKAEEDAEIAALKNRPSPCGAAARSPNGRNAASPAASPTSPASGRGELVVSRGKVRRAGAERWSKRKERIFFDELAATANITMAAEAAGVSTNAVHARRLKHRLFAAKWAAVEAAAKSSINMHLIEEAKKTFDPANLDTGDVKPRVSIDQAIKISQIGAKKAQQEEVSDPFEDEAASLDEEGLEAVRESIFGKLQRIRASNRREQLKLGWSYDESFDEMIPPGWIKGPDYKPKPAHLPINYYSKYPGAAPPPDPDGDGPPGRTQSGGRDG